MTYSASGGSTKSLACSRGWGTTRWPCKLSSGPRSSGALVSMVSSSEDNVEVDGSWAVAYRGYAANDLLNFF